MSLKNINGFTLRYLAISAIEVKKSYPDTFLNIFYIFVSLHHQMHLCNFMATTNTNNGANNNIDRYCARLLLSIIMILF